MCGILAGSGKILPEIISTIGCLSADRGTDSSGIAWHDVVKLHSLKTTDHPIPAFNISLHDGIVKACENKNIIGHTRFATLGAVTPENAHPFIIDGIAFAHNGMISNHEKFGKYDVDSMSLIHGIKKKDFSEYVGSIALLWIEKGKMFAYRKGNPLFRGRNGDALYLASEEKFLAEVGCKKIKEIKEGTIYTIEGGIITNVERVKSNQAYSNANSNYSADNYQAGHYEEWSEGGWIKRDRWGNRIEKNISFKNEDMCQCGHKGSHHRNGTVSSCWFQTSPGCQPVYCPCNLFRHDKETVIIGKKEIDVKKDGLMCLCGHTSEDHKEYSAFYQTFLCSVKDKYGAICDCYDGFTSVEQDKHIPEGFVVPDLCTCGHYEIIHSAQGKGGARQCNANSCACVTFRASLRKEGPEKTPLLPLISEKSMCDCKHEFEYHDNTGLHPCEIVENGRRCYCSFFARRSRFKRGRPIGFNRSHIS